MLLSQVTGPFLSCGTRWVGWGLFKRSMDMVSGGPSLGVALLRTFLRGRDRLLERVKCLGALESFGVWPASSVPAL